MYFMSIFSPSFSLLSESDYTNKMLVDWEFFEAAGCLKTCRLEFFLQLIEHAGCKRTMQAFIF